MEERGVQKGGAGGKKSVTLGGIEEKNDEESSDEELSNSLANGANCFKLGFWEKRMSSVSVAFSSPISNSARLLTTVSLFALILAA